MHVANEELFFIDKEGDSERIILYAPLRSYLALISRGTMRALIEDSQSNERRSIIQNLSSRPLISMKNILSGLVESTPQLSLALTDDCNLRCTYCHASAGEKHKNRSMSNHMIESVLKCYFDKIKEKESEEIKIIFMGGGEPTYVYKKLKFAVSKAQQYASLHGKSCIFTMATNGVYGNSVRSFIVDNFKQVSLSFDGLGHIQNKHRPLENKKASFDIVYETARYFFEKKFPFSIRTTVSDYSVNYIMETIAFFAENFPGITIGIEPLSLSGRALINDVVSPPDEGLFAQSLIYAIDSAVERNVKVVNSASSEFSTLRPVFCSSVGVPNWTVSVDGLIQCCSRDGAPEAFTFGKYDFEKEDILLDSIKMEYIRTMNVLNYEECSECFMKYHCAGDCPDRRLTFKYDCKPIKKVGSHILNSKIGN